MDLFRDTPRPPSPPASSPPGSRAASADRDPRPITVTRLNERIQRILADGFAGGVRVRGEISNLSRRNHWYFSLKDDTSAIACVSFRSDVRRFDATLANGDEVVATGRVDHWTTGGRTQLYVTGLERAGEGTLKQRYDALVRELRQLGWFADERKRALPALPRRIAVITSESGAAIHDVRKTVQHRLPAVGLVLYDVRVQGEAAADQVVAAIRRVQRDAGRHRIDAILLTRGGGSLEDLWTFNERAVAEAIVACTLPVVAAIGHESDITIAELVADVRASTPTQAAMLLVPDRAELGQHVDHLAGRLAGGLRRRLERARERLDGHASRPVLRDARALLDAPRAALQRQQERRQAAMRARLTDARLQLGELAGRWREARPSARQAARREQVARLTARLHAVTRRRLDRATAAVPTRRALDGALHHHLAAVRARLERQARGIALLDPSAILGRGFTYTTRAADGGLVRGPAEAAAGAVILTHGRDGILRSVVEADGGGGGGGGGNDGGGGEEGGTPPRSPRRRSTRGGQGSPRSGDAATGGLFASVDD